VRWKLYSYIVSKVYELWSRNGLKPDLHFYLPFVNSASYFIVKLRTRKSANRTQPNFARRWTVNHANILLGPSSRKMVAKKLHIRSVFRRLRDFVTNIFGRKHKYRHRKLWNVVLKPADEAVFSLKLNVEQATEVNANKHLLVLNTLSIKYSMYGVTCAVNYCVYTSRYG